MVPTERIELSAPSLPWKCSTPELSRHPCALLVAAAIVGARRNSGLALQDMIEGFDGSESEIRTHARQAV